MNSKITHPQFSFFKGPVTNIKPKVAVSIIDVYRGITSDYYRNPVMQIRNSSTPEEKREAKRQLDYVTFAGEFNKRDKNELVKASGYACIDLDHIESNNLPIIKKQLLSDTMFETQLLFVSPSGHGLKWIIEVDLNHFSYEINFLGIIAYLKKAHQLGTYIDTSVKDIARACFMSYDPDAFVHSKYL